jgi:putative phosphoribosyl transferase
MLTHPLTARRLPGSRFANDWPDERYADRELAGRQLAERLFAYRGGRALVLALPPGGIIVGYELARALRLPLDVLVGREFNTPPYPAIAAGAICEGGGLCLNRAVLRLPSVTPEVVWDEARRAREELVDLVERYRGDRPLPPLGRRPIILVDDGLGDGLLQLASIQSLRRAHARRCVVATPHATSAAARHVTHVADELVTLDAVGEEHDDQAIHWRYLLGDDEMALLLNSSF